MKLCCIECGWTGDCKQARWIDMSNFYDDSMCDNQKGSGMWECPKCKGLCVPDKVSDNQTPKENGE